MPRYPLIASGIKKDEEVANKDISGFSRIPR